MNRVLSGSAFLLCLAFASAASAQADQFAYTVPPAFLDLSKDAPAANFAQAPATAIERARQFAKYGVVMKDARAVAEVTVTVEDGHGPPSDSLSTIANLASKQPGFRVLTKDTVELQQVECAKLDFVATVGTEQLEKIAYILPLGPKRALVTLEARTKDIELFRDRFEASVAGVRGLQEAADPTTNTLRVSEFLLVVGGAALLGKVLRRKRKRKRKPKRNPSAGL